MISFFSWVTIISLMISPSLGENPNNSTNTNNSSSSSIGTWFGGLSWGDVLLLTAIFLVILVLLGVMALQRRRAHRILERNRALHHTYANTALQAQTIALPIII